MKDMNAKIGADNTNSKHIMSKYGIGVQNENGGIFVEFCAFNDLVIGGTSFPHETTWFFSDGKTSLTTPPSVASGDKTCQDKTWRSRGVKSPPGFGSTQNQVEDHCTNTTSTA